MKINKDRKVNLRLCSFACWYCSKNDGKTQRIQGTDLNEVKQDKGHIDFCCPKCEHVVICEVRR